MRIRSLYPLFILMLSLFGLACGDDDKGPTDPNPPGNETYFMRAKIDGASWSVSTTDLAFAASHTSAGLYVVIAQPTGGHRIQMVLSSITGPGTYAIGVGANLRGGSATLSLNPSTWVAPNSGAAGSITLAQVSDTLLVGTFSFAADAVGGTPAGTKNVTDGEFRLPVTTIGAIGPVPDNAWSEVRATVAGSPWSAAGIATQFSTPTLSIVAFTNTRTITMTLAEVDGPGVYAISQTLPLRSITAIGDGVDPLVCCWGPTPPATGSVTITSITSTRIRGTFEASLEASPFGTATGTLVIVNGSFDNGLIVPPPGLAR